eukprot:10818097-Karenia_brevis.AAC.1
MVMVMRMIMMMMMMMMMMIIFLGGSTRFSHVCPLYKPPGRPSGPVSQGALLRHAHPPPFLGSVAPVAFKMATGVPPTRRAPLAKGTSTLKPLRLGRVDSQLLRYHQWPRTGG